MKYTLDTKTGCKFNLWTLKEYLEALGTNEGFVSGGGGMLKKATSEVVSYLFYLKFF